MHRPAGRNIGLDRAVEPQENYRRSGFRLAHRNIRFTGKSARIGTKPPQKLSPESIGKLTISGIERYDGEFFAGSRSTFLRAWIEQQRGRGLVVKRCGVIVGYGLLRVCRCGFKFGPLFADSPLVAETLVGLLAEAIPVGSALNSAESLCGFYHKEVTAMKFERFASIWKIVFASPSRTETELAHGA